MKAYIEPVSQLAARLSYGERRSLVGPPEKAGGPAIDVREELRERFKFLKRDEAEYLAVQPSSKNYNDRKSVRGDRLASEAAAIGLKKVVIIGAASDSFDCIEAASAIEASGFDVELRVGAGFEESLSIIYNASCFLGCESWGGLAAGFFGVESQHLYKCEQAFQQFNPYLEKYTNYHPRME